MEPEQHMPYRTARLAAGAVAVLGLLTACSGETGGTAEPPASTSASPGGNSGAPKVPASLPTQQLISDPCSALGPDDATKVGFKSPGELDTSQQLPICHWTSPRTSGNQVAIGPLTPNKNGLSDTYALKPKQAYFEPTTVEGYPGVYASQSDARTRGSCALTVGVTDQLAVVVTLTITEGPNKADPCTLTARVAAAMIDHLKTAS
ncbi:DUF3558 domain-containing protein [Amycolatopsis ultiminotia]|uniref:DUF3558 domain-containing protein n=1 Tax=Amycolatopsis ultiminotia TaxID=543629 RepID=A0ABP6VI49_9PSEU